MGAASSSNGISSRTTASEPPPRPPFHQHMNNAGSRQSAVTDNGLSIDDTNRERIESGASTPTLSGDVHSQVNQFSTNIHCFYSRNFYSKSPLRDADPFLLLCQLGISFFLLRNSKNFLVGVDLLHHLL